MTSRADLLERLAALFSAAHQVSPGGIPQALGIVLDEYDKLTNRLVGGRPATGVPRRLLGRVVECVAAGRGVREGVIYGNSRLHENVLARVEVWLILRTLRYSTTVIGKAFEKDHSTVVTQVAKWRHVLEADPSVRARIAWLTGQGGQHVAVGKAA